MTEHKRSNNITNIVICIYRYQPLMMELRTRLKIKAVTPPRTNGRDLLKHEHTRVNVPEVWRKMSLKAGLPLTLL